MALKLPNSISLDFFRRQLAQATALPQLAVLAIVTGLLTGFVILGFRLAIDVLVTTFVLPVDDSEAFESLSALESLALPVIGALLIGLLLNSINPADRRVGVVHVMERLSRHQGYMPNKNTLIQFFGGIIALASGQSGGREGPAVHLGAASASILGRRFELPNNSIRTLIACGTAAAIASSFNTPIAGVIFAMEVVMMDYAIGSFIPVILSAVTATLLSHYFLGNEPAFAVYPFQMESLAEIPFIIFGGAVIGTLAAGYIWLVQQFAKFNKASFWIRATLAGVITGVAALFAPEVLGVGYDTLNSAILGELAFVTLLLVVVLKSITSAAAVGLGLPVGLIGPTLIIGAAMGGMLGFIGSTFYPDESASQGFYVMLGMSAMMAAVLQAPLAALMAVLELTANPNFILPAMLMIVVATLTTSEVFSRKSVFLSTLNTLGLQYPPNPTTLHMQRAGVASIMQRDIQRLEPEVSIETARAALAQNPSWILVEPSPGEFRCILNANDLRAFIEELESDDGAEADSDSQVVQLMQLPGMRKDIENIDFRATIQQAQETLRDSSAEALCVRRTSAPTISRPLGIITQENIDNYRDIAR